MIELRGVTKQFQNETAIAYRDMTFADGKSYMLLGASGCGKSTLLNMIAGVLSPTSGSIWIDGENMTEKSKRERDLFRIRRIGYVFQDFKLIPDMTVLDNIQILQLEGVDTSGVIPLLQALDMEPWKNKKVRRLSGGQKQRVAIARALVKKPQIILADEPTGNLNFAIGETVIKELLREAKGKTLIAVTHDERLACHFDEVIDMNRMILSKQDVVSGEVIG